MADTFLERLHRAEEGARGIKPEGARAMAVASLLLVDVMRDLDELTARVVVLEEQARGGA